MGVYRLTRAAETRLAQIYEYSLFNFGEIQADRYFNALHDTFSMLADMPEIGRPFRLWRRHEHQSHVIFYQPTVDGGLIVTLLHHSENIDDQMR